MEESLPLIIRLVGEIQWPSRRAKLNVSVHVKRSRPLEGEREREKDRGINRGIKRNTSGLNIVT